jgi:hypothetical protein
MAYRTDQRHMALRATFAAIRWGAPGVSRSPWREYTRCVDRGPLPIDLVGGQHVVQTLPYSPPAANHVSAANTSCGILARRRLRWFYGIPRGRLHVAQSVITRGVRDGRSTNAPATLCSG